MRVWTSLLVALAVLLFAMPARADNGDAPPAPLSERGLDNLTAFARLYGYVRYFHPSDEAAAADWDAFLLAGVEDVESAYSDRALRDALRMLFAPVAPGVRIVRAEDSAPNLDPPEGETIFWLHRGLGSAWPGRTTIFSSTRVTEGPVLPTFALVELPRGLIAYVPLRVERRDGLTLPRATMSFEPRDMPRGWAPSGNDRTTRLAVVIEAWNIAQHFYPQMETQGVDWSAQLAVSLRQAALDPDAIAFDRTTRQLALALRDGHATLRRADISGAMPFAWEWIENRVVVTAVGPGVSAVRPGDVILAINDRSIPELLAQAAPLFGGATREQLRLNALDYDILRGDAGSQARLTLDRNGQTLSADLRLISAADERTPPPRPAVIAEFEPGLLYVDLTRLSDADLTPNLERMAAARAIIFDMRGYPTTAARRVLPHLASTNVRSDQFNLPIYTQPDQHNVVYQRGGWDMAPEAPRFQGVFVFVTDERATSYGESIMSVVEDNALGPIVGAHTAGTNGDINRVALLAGYAMGFTGVQVVKPDGSRRFGVGVQPTIPARRTIAGVRAGHDEVLEAAIAAARMDTHAEISSPPR